jgi:hypothetical protein
MMSMCNGTQHIGKQMAIKFLIKMAVRDEAMGLIKNNNLPPHVVSLLSELLHLPEPRVLMKGVSVNDSEIIVLGAPMDIRDLTLFEEIAIRNSSSYLLEKDLAVTDHSIEGNFYSRFKVSKSQSIFTSSSYRRSPKRANFFAFMKDGNFFMIESILTIQIDNISKAFVIGRKLGTHSKKTYVPEPIKGTTFSEIPGHTTRLIGLSNELYAYDPISIKAKGVCAMMNKLTETFVITAIVNTFETD